MRGSLAEFTLTHLLQLFGVAERTGAIALEGDGQRLTLLVEVGRISGIGIEGFDARTSLLQCELLPAASRARLEALTPRSNTPGLSLLARNAVDPDRWDAFVQRVLEQHVYPLLNREQGEFDVVVGRCPPTTLRVSMPIQQVILDGSRWEAELEALAAAGYATSSAWRRAAEAQGDARSFTSAQWLVWAIASAPLTIGEAARRLCLPELDTAAAVKRLNALGVLERVPG